jgi:hypothetical protein
MKKHNALARLSDRQDDYLRFTRDFRAPPDNNDTERNIRMAKLKQKIVDGALNHYRSIITRSHRVMAVCNGPTDLRASCPPLRYPVAIPGWRRA